MFDERVLYILAVAFIYENAIAERVNGILKDELYLNQAFDNVENSKKASKSKINLYNEIRLHLFLTIKKQIWFISYQLSSILTYSYISWTGIKIKNIKNFN